MIGTETGEDGGIDAERLGLFFGVLLALALGVVAVGLASGIGVLPLLGPYMFTPAAAAVVVRYRRDLSWRALGVRVGRVRWLGLAVVAVLALVGATLAISLVVPGVAFDPGADPISGITLPPGLPGLAATLVLAVALGATVNAVFALGEELGWRGYLLWELAPLGFWRASLAIGAVWGLWHAPAIIAGYNYPNYPVVGVAAMTVATVAFAPVYTYVVVRARSVIPAALFHGVFNGSAGVVLAYAVTDGPALRELVASPVGAAGILAFLLADVAIAVAGPPTLERSFRAPDEGDGDGDGGVGVGVRR